MQNFQKKKKLASLTNSTKEGFVVIPKNVNRLENEKFIPPYKIQYWGQVAFELGLT